MSIPVPTSLMVSSVLCSAHISISTAQNQSFLVSLRDYCAGVTLTDTDPHTFTNINLIGWIQ